MPCIHEVPSELNCAYCTPGRFLPPVRTRTKGQVHTDRKSLDVFESVQAGSSGSSTSIPFNRRKAREFREPQHKDAVDKKLDVVDEQLAGELNRLRAVLAGELPRYVVFNNETLRILARTKPRTLAGLRSVKGIGAARIEKYGKEILDAIERMSPQTG